MEIRDYLSSAAILVSLASFCVAIWGAWFSRKSKLSELRAAVLVKAAELSNRISRLHELHAQMRRHAEEIGDVRGLAIISVQDFERIHANADLAYRKLSSWPSARGLEAYEAFFHDFHSLNEQVATLEQSSISQRDRYLKITKPAPTGPTNN